MKRRNWIARLIVLLLAAVMLLSSAAGASTAAKKKKKKTAAPTVTVSVAVTPAPKATAAPPAETAVPEPMAAAQELADYLFTHDGELPEYFVTKQEAEALGWKTRYRYVGDIAPGLCIGGDYFGNYQGKLPRVRRRKYYEADCFYNGKERNEYRVIWADDGSHVWFTADHYETFIELFPSAPEGGKPDE